MSTSPKPAAASSPQTAPKPRGPVAWTLAACILGLPWAVAVFWPTRDAFTDLRRPASALAIAAVFIAAFFERSNGPSLPGASRMRPIHIAAALVWVGLALSTIFSPAPGLSLRVALRESLWLALALRLATLPLTRRAVSLVLNAYFAAAVAQAAFAFVQRGAPSLVNGATGRAAMLGSLGNPEYLTGYLAPALAASVVWLSFSWRPFRRALFPLLVAMITGAAIIFGGGRGAALGATVAIGAVLVVQRRSSALPHARLRIPRVVWGIAVAALALILVLFIIGGEARRQSLAGRAAELFDPHSASTRHRIGLWSITSSMVAQNPVFGCGPGLFGAEFDRERGRLARESNGVGAWAFNEFLNDQSAGEAHNDPLQWWAEYGLLPVSGLLLVMGTSIARLLRGRTAQPQDLMLAAALIALAIGSLFAFPLHRPARAFLFWTFAGLAQRDYSR